MAIGPDTPIHDYFQSFSEPVRTKLLTREQNFKDMGYLTVGSFESAFNVKQLPDFDRSRSIVTTANSIYKKSTNLNQRKKQFAQSFKLNAKEVDQLSRSALEISRSINKIRRPSSSGYYGSLGATTLKSSRSFKIVRVSDLNYKVPGESKDRWVLPDIKNRLGNVWNQAFRGTCVAFAVAGLANYIHPFGKRPSPQFLYHQCKLVDGSPRQSGTYINTALNVLAGSKIPDRSQLLGSTDWGIPDEKTWPYNEKTIVGNEAQTPPPIKLREEIYSSPRWGSTNGEIIKLSRGPSIVNELRTLLRSANIPIAFGIPVFPSWENEYTWRTGLLTVPLTDDQNIGHHAMLVCGYDDSQKLFLVRNSYGDDWAYENPWKMPGYALIPYMYFEKYAQEAFSLRHLSIVDDIDIPEVNRLYNEKPSIISRKSTFTVADLKSMTGTKKKSVKYSIQKRRTKKSLVRKFFGLLNPFG